MAQSRGITLQTFEQMCCELLEAVTCLSFAVRQQPDFSKMSLALSSEHSKMHLSVVALGQDPSACLCQTWLQAWGEGAGSGQALLGSAVGKGRAAHTTGHWDRECGEGEALLMRQVDNCVTLKVWRCWKSEVAGAELTASSCQGGFAHLSQNPWLSNTCRFGRTSAVALGDACPASWETPPWVLQYIAQATAAEIPDPVLWAWIQSSTSISV